MEKLGPVLSMVWDGLLKRRSFLDRLKIDLGYVLILVMM